jgi:hypothetical protein
LRRREGLQPFTLWPDQAIEQAARMSRQGREEFILIDQRLQPTSVALRTCTTSNAGPQETFVVTRKAASNSHRAGYITLQRQEIGWTARTIVR